MQRVVERLSKLKTEGDIHAYLKTISPLQCKEIVAYLDDTYYNGTSKCPDFVYDVIRGYANMLSADVKSKVGSKVRDDVVKVSLPFWLGSMTKLKDDAEIDRWCNRNRSFTYVCTEKLDGVSCLITYDSMGLMRMFTRGDGAVGADITFIRDHIQGIPKTALVDVAIRGELLVAKDDFAKHNKEYSNARNMVSGIVNAKTIKPGIRDIRFVAYEVISSDGQGLPLSEQLELLNEFEFTVVKSTSVREIDNGSLLTILRRMADQSIFEIDGIVVYSNMPYTRNTEGNPEYAFAFKTNDDNEKVVTSVTNVEWNLSRHGFYNPLVCLVPVKCDGVIIRQATGFNAKYIIDNKIGPGAKVEVVGSGKVIPYITRGLKISDTGTLPDKFKWTETGVDIYLPDDEESEDVEKRKVVHFFVTLEIPFVNEGIVTKLFDAGFRTLFSILNVKREQLEKLSGFGVASASKIIDSLRSVKTAPLYKLMAASTIFGVGFGAKKCKRLTDAFPDMLTQDVTVEQVADLEGFSTKTAMQFVPKIEEFRRFYTDLSQFITVDEAPLTAGPSSSARLDIKVVFTGFRSTVLEQKVVSVGGEVQASVTKKTTHVVTTNPSEGTVKLKKAVDLGIPIISPDQLAAMLPN